MWIGVLLMCLNPSALSCQVIAKSTPFYSEQTCNNEAVKLAKDLIAKGVYAVPSCIKVGTSI